MFCSPVRYSSPSQRLLCTWGYVQRAGEEDLLEDCAAGGLKSEQRAHAGGGMLCAPRRATRYRRQNWAVCVTSYDSWSCRIMWALSQVQCCASRLRHVTLLKEISASGVATRRGEVITAQAVSYENSAWSFCHCGRSS